MVAFMVAFLAESRSGKRSSDAKMENRFQAMDVKMENRFQAMDAKMENRFQAMDDKIDGLRHDMDSRFDTVFAELRGVRQDLGYLAGRVGVELPAHPASL